MKKSFLPLLFFVTFIQCSTPQYTAEEKALIEKYDIPRFSSEEITRFAFEYVRFYEEIQNAAQTGDMEKIEVASQIAPEMAEKALKITHKMSPRDVHRWVNFVTDLAKASLH